MLYQRDWDLMPLESFAENRGVIQLMETTPKLGFHTNVWMWDQQQLQVMFPNSSTTRPRKNKGSLKDERNVKETTPATPTPSPKKQQFFHESLANSDGMPPPRRDPSRSSFLMMEILSPQAPLKYHLNCWESKQTFGVVTSSHK